MTNAADVGAAFFAFALIVEGVRRLSPIIVEAWQSCFHHGLKREQESDGSV